MEKIKPVVTEKYDFEYRDKSIIIITPVTFRDYRDFDAKNTHEFSIKSYSLRVDVLMETLMKEIKSVGTEKNENEYRDLSILIALFEL